MNDQRPIFRARPPWKAMGVSVVLIVIFLVVWWLAAPGERPGRVGESDSSEGLPRSGPAFPVRDLFETAPAPAPESMPASARARPGDAAACEWVPPRFADRQAQRDRMVAVIRDLYELKDPGALAALSAVPRHEFVPKGLAGRAHDDTPLPIGHGQTISQPYIVAEMTRQLKLDADSRVLEIGTGSGYQAAVLTEFTPRVWTIEIVAPLAGSAADRLRRLGYHTVRVRHGDGYEGWPEAAPFDAIIVTCAAGQIPPPLLKQLAPGGRMVIPVGQPFATQSLMLVEKDAEGRTRSRSLMPVAFVPLLRKDPSGK